jgi:hypothetical protein
VRYEIDGPFSFMGNCHCSMCRKHHGAMVVTWVAAPASGFRWVAGKDHVDTYRSSENAHRSFCRTCGSVTPIVMPDGETVVAPAGNLEGDLGIEPQMHMFAASRAAWYPITDTLPQHAVAPAEFGLTPIERATFEPKEGVTQGSCLCGDVAFEFTGKPARVMNCFCSRCRRGRSAAHATNYFVKLEQFRFTRGEEGIQDFQFPEAKYFGVAFCRRCGSDVPRVSVERGVAVVPGGTLDTDPGKEPQANIFVSSKAPWVEITNPYPQFAEMPPSR